jgi:hypothetical protein
MVPCPGKGSISPYEKIASPRKGVESLPYKDYPKSTSAWEPEGVLMTSMRFEK